MTNTFDNALDQLIVVPMAVPLRASEDEGIGSEDLAEALDATYEDLPQDATCRDTACECSANCRWPQCLEQAA